jgi:FkbM family methyltransferase
MLTYFRLLMRKKLRKGPSRNGATEKIAGHRLRYTHSASIYRLFTEVFVDLDYFFTADNEAPFIIDCGSNIGMSILFFKVCYPHARIIGFEPDSDAFMLLQENMKANNVDDVTLRNRALWNTAGAKDLYVDPNSPASLRVSLLEDRISDVSHEVESVVLSNYIDREVDFLKMDIEGAEHVVFKELAESGKLRQIKETVFEYHHHIREEEDNLSEALKILEDEGFGYQIRAGTDRAYQRAAFQDMLIHAYRKQ